MLTKEHIPNLLSISRVPSSALFLLTFSIDSIIGFWLSVLVLLVATLTDFLDGYLARRWSVTSELGYFLDGLGDKCFTVSICLAVTNLHPTLSLLAWALISREIALYALRAVDQNRNANLLRLRSISLWQAGMIRLFFLLFIVGAALRVHDVSVPEPEYIALIITGCIAMLCGWTTVVALGYSLAKAAVGKP